MTVPASAVTTHVLDTALGRPAAGVPVRLEDEFGRVVATSATDADGRARDLGPGRLEAGVYRLVFDTSAYFGHSGQNGFYPEVRIVFTLADPEQHHHVPLLLSPYGYSTYRGS
jgi:5-hydroxyisourate hydrolase